MSIDAFHAHLDNCERCARNPFDLCAVGDALLLAAAVEDDAIPDGTVNPAADALGAAHGEIFPLLLLLPCRSVG